MPRLTAVLLAFFFSACGAAQQQTEVRTKAVDAELKRLRDAAEAQRRSMVSLKDRLALLEDRLESRAIHGGSAGIPPGLVTVRLKRGEARAHERPAPEPSGPVPNITQSDMDALDRPLARGGPRTAHPFPDNAAGAPNLGVMDLPEARSRDYPSARRAPVRTPTPLPMPRGTPGEPLDPILHPVGAYKAALARHKSGDLIAAIRGYQDFAARFPGHDYADNSLYGLGKCRYQRAEFAGALKAFRSVITEYPSGNMVPDALLMIGRTQKKLGRLAEGRETLSRLATTYPKTLAGQRAAVEMNARHR